jgi:hypothetical protein
MINSLLNIKKVIILYTLIKQHEQKIMQQTLTELLSAQFISRKDCV